MITRQVRIVKNAEEEIRQLKRKLDNFDRYASAANLPTVNYNTIAVSPMAATPSCAHSMGSLINSRWVYNYVSYYSKKIISQIFFLFITCQQLILNLQILIIFLRK